MSIYQKIITVSFLIVYPFFTNSVNAVNLNKTQPTPPDSSSVEGAVHTPITLDAAIDQMIFFANTVEPFKSGEKVPFSNDLIEHSIVMDFIKGITKTNKLNQLASFIVDKYNLHQKESQKIVQTTYEMSANHDIPPLTMLAVIEVESSFNVKAKNKNAVGLTQAISTIHRSKFKGNNVYDIKTNINVGAEVLSDCYKKYQGVEVKALRCYHGDTISSTPNSYVKSVMAKKQNFLLALNTI